MLRGRGVDVETGSAGAARRPASAPDRWRVRPGPICAPGTIAIEPDLSNAAPFLAAALVTGGEVTIAGWPAASLQAGGQIIDLLDQMGAAVRAVRHAACASSGTGAIHGITADLRDIGELAPVLTALAALADSPSEFTGIGHMRLHESDRLAALAARDRRARRRGDRAGRRAADQAAAAARRGVVFDSHDDHRLVMAAAVLGLAVPGPARSATRPPSPRRSPPSPVWQQMLAARRPEQARASHARLDEDDVRVRPGKGSRPRTRRRPAHEDAIDAFVTGVDRGRYRCWTGDRMITAMKATGAGPRRHRRRRHGPPHR